MIAFDVGLEIVYWHEEPPATTSQYLNSLSVWMILNVNKFQY